MSGNNGNGNGHREYERADTPPSGNEFGELLTLARDVNDTKIAVGIIKDDLDMTRLSVGSVHTALQRMRHDIDTRDANVTQAILELTAAVNESNKTAGEALDFARRAFMKSESAERASLTNETSMDLVKTAAHGLSKAVDVLADKRSDSIRARADWRGVWVEYAKKSLPYVLAAAGLIYGVAVKACNQ